MTIPYRVTVKSEGRGGIHVNIVPMPIAATKEFVPVVVMTIQNILTKIHMNTVRGRSALKQELEKAVADLHGQGIIRPESKP